MKTQKIIVLDVFGVAQSGAGLNHALLDGVQRYRKLGAKVYFASNMGAAQRVLFWSVLKLKDFGEEIFCSGDLGVAKPDPAFYSRVADAIGAAPESILFFDDSAVNVDAARRCHWHGFVYHDAATTFQEIENFHGF